MMKDEFIQSEGELDGLVEFADFGGREDADAVLEAFLRDGGYGIEVGGAGFGEAFFLAQADLDRDVAERSGNVLDDGLDCFQQDGNILLAGFEDGLGAEVEVLVGDYVADAFQSLPVHLGILDQELRVRELINLLETLSDGGQLHAKDVKDVFVSLTGVKVFRAVDGFHFLADPLRGFPD
jgi:hypothetical protein